MVSAMTSPPTSIRTGRDRLADIDAMEWLARVADDPLVLLVPVVEACEVERHVAGQVLVHEPEPGAHAVVDRDGLARGRVHAERDPRVQHAGHLTVRGGRRRQCGADVLDRNGVGRDHASRLPEEDRARAVDDGLDAEDRPDALLDRLVTKLAEGLVEYVLYPFAHEKVRRTGADRYSHDLVGIVWSVPSGLRLLARRLVGKVPRRSRRRALSATQRVDLRSQPLGAPAAGECVVAEVLRLVVGHFLRATIASICSRSEPAFACADAAVSSPFATAAAAAVPWA